MSEQKDFGQFFKIPKKCSKCGVSLEGKTQFKNKKTGKITCKKCYLGGLG